MNSNIKLQTNYITCNEETQKKKKKKKEKRKKKLQQLNIQIKQ